jgi:dolichol-phosphate mannosyltransferase
MSNLANSISIIIPIYKEKKNFLRLIKSLYKNVKYSFEVIIIDDNSRDGVVEIFNKIKSKYKKVRLIVRDEKPRDLTKSCIVGFKNSKFENILVMDGDLQHDPIFINKMCKEYFQNKHDIVIGARDFSDRKSVQNSFVRFFFSKLITCVINFFFKTLTTDPMSGFFIFKKDIYLKYRKNLFLKGYKILLDLILSSEKRYKLKEIKIKFKLRSREKSKMSAKILILLIYFIFIKKFRKYFY